MSDGPLTPRSHLDPVAQSRGFFGGGQIPAGPSGPGVTPDDTWKVGSNSFAKSGVVFGILAIPLGWIQVAGYLFTLGFGGVAILLGAIGLLRARNLPGKGGRYIAVFAIALGVGVIVWKLIEGTGPLNNYGTLATPTPQSVSHASSISSNSSRTRTGSRTPVTTLKGWCPDR